MLAIRRLLQRQEDLLADRLRAYFRDLSAIVVRRFMALSRESSGRLGADLKDVTPELLLGAEDEAALLRIISGALGDVIETHSELAGELVGEPPLAIGDPGYSLIQRQIARRVVDINATTRRAIQDTLIDGLNRGYAARQIAEGVPDDEFRGLRSIVRETYKGRAQTIARTETADVAQRAADDRYRAAGVEEVDIYDGPGCGWTSHDDPDVADGSRRTLAELAAHRLSHPNCVRVPYPVIPGID